MNHPTALTLSMLADNALDATQAEEVTAHVGSCAACQAHVSAMRTESQYLVSAMRIEAAELPPAPKFSRPLSLRNFALANVATGLAIWLCQFLWKTLFGEVMVNAATWFTSIYLPDIYAVASTTVLYFLAEGTAMFEAYLGLIVTAVLVFSAVVLWLKYHRAQVGLNLCLCALLTTAVTVPTPAHALDVRRSEDVITIGADETINDTLVVAAESVIIEGDVTGNLIAVGQAIDISGNVGGSVITFAESVKVRGTVGGSVIGGASAFALTGATIGGDTWIGGESVAIDNSTTIGSNATLAGETITVDGDVSKDLYTFCETAEVNGRVTGNLEAFAARVRLLSDANIGGNVNFRSRNEDNLYRADGAQVGGEIQFSDMPEELESENRYTQPQFYLWQGAQLIGAFLVGWALLTLVPGMGRLSIGAGAAGLKSAGIGLLTLVSVPIMAILAAVTIIGLPVAIIAFGLWILGLYLTVVVIGSVIGRQLLPDNDSVPQTLLVGLLLVTVAANLPFIGGIIAFILTIVGLGLLVEYVYTLVTRRQQVEI